MEKTLEDFMNEAAVEHGYADWAQIDMTDSEQWERDSLKVILLGHVIDRYASYRYSQGWEDSHKADIEKLREYESGMNSAIFHLTDEPPECPTNVKA